MKIVTDNLDVWSSAIKAKSSAGRGGGKKQELYGVKKLRELILELAVRGLLVEQDPTEQSAIHCLEAANSGVLKFDPNSNQPAPSGWISLPLGCMIASNIGGGTPSKGNPSYWDGEIPWASVKDIQAEKLIDSTIDKINDDGLKNSSSNLIPPNRLLVVTRMGLGKLAINTCAMAINQDLRAIEPTSALDLDYGYLLFKGLNLVGKGVTVKGVTVKVLHATQVLLPPLAEQHRIVAKVDELMALCDQLEQQQEDSLRTHDTLVATLLGALTAASERGQFAQAWQRIEANFDTLFTTQSSIDQLKQTILQLAVMGKLVEQDPEDEPASKLLAAIAAEKEKLIRAKKLRRKKPLPPIAEGEAPFEAPKGWSVARFSEVCQEVATGPFGTMIHKRDYVDGGVPLINPSHLINGKIVENQSVSVSPEKAADLSSYSIYEGDIVMARRGEMGRCAVVTGAQERWLCGTGSFVLKFHSEVSRRFILLLFLSEKVRSYLGGESVGITMTNLNHGILNNLPVVLPPAKEQERIADEIERLTALCDRLKANLKTAQTTQLNLADNLVEQAIV